MVSKHQWIVPDWDPHGPKQSPLAGEQMCDLSNLEPRSLWPRKGLAVKGLPRFISSEPMWPKYKSI